MFTSTTLKNTPVVINKAIIINTTAIIANQRCFGDGCLTRTVPVAYIFDNLVVI